MLLILGKDELVVDALVRSQLRELLYQYCEAETWGVVEEIVDILENDGVLVV